MAKTATIQTRVDPTVKHNAQIILKKLNISMSEAISMYLSQITLSSIAIQRDLVDMLVWTKEAQLVFVIKSREVARTFREYFGVLWRMARK